MELKWVLTNVGITCGYVIWGKTNFYFIFIFIFLVGMVFSIDPELNIWLEILSIVSQRFGSMTLLYCMVKCMS